MTTIELFLIAWIISFIASLFIPPHRHSISRTKEIIISAVGSFIGVFYGMMVIYIIFGHL